MKGYFEDLGNYLSLKDRVYYNIKFQIIIGTLKPGTRLPEEEIIKNHEYKQSSYQRSF
jgi:DNA-binding GntR family transcriptional regulator